MSALILTYHRVAEGPDPLLQCVPPDLFAAQLDVLSELAAVVPLADVASGTGTRVALTFDDGYADNASLAAPLLVARELPATFFVPSRIVDDGAEYWWDRLEHAHFDAAPRIDEVDVTIAGIRLRVDVRTPDGRARSHKALNRRLRRLPVTTSDALADEVARQLGAAVRPSCDRHALLEATALAELAAQPLFEIGSHGVTHSMLSALSDEEQLRELRSSRATLEEATGGIVTSLAYPYGTTDAYGPATPGLARQAGYVRACVNTGGRLDAQRAPFQLPRHMVYAWDADAFRRTVREWFTRA